MILHNILSGFTLLAFLTTSFLAVFTWQLPQAAAQTDSLTPQSCPIGGEIEVGFASKGESSQGGENTFGEMIQLSNSTNYSFAGVRVAVAAYSDPSDTVPAYWSVLPEEYQVLAGDTVGVPVGLDLSSVSAGEYTIKVFAIQGDETAALGAVLRDVEAANGITYKKADDEKFAVTVAVTVNGESFTGQTIELERGKIAQVEVETTNHSDNSFVGGDMLGVITEGSVPLGAAVQVDKLEAVRLIPDANRVTKFYEPHVEGGEYTIYAGHIDGTAFRPLVAVPAQVTEVEGDDTWAYVSQVGLSSYPLQADTAAVACVKYVGAGEGANRFREPVGVEFVVSADSNDLATKRVTVDEVDTFDYFAFTPQVEAENLTLSVDFLQKRLNVATYPDLEEGVGEELEDEDPADISPETDNYFVVDTISQSFTCEGEECVKAVPEAVGGEQSTAAQKSFWFYAAIVIAAALLMYIMLRRLGTEDSGSPIEASDSELQ